jgi:methenyltetrahydromethanopterin cyclohydrolase
MNLNEMAWWRCDELAAAAEKLGISVSKSAGGTRIIDCGVQAPGGLEAGRALAEISLSGLGQVSFSPGRTGDWIGPVVAIHTDQPVLACMCSEYAGWQVTGEKFFGMGSGPMRCVACREPLIEYLGYREKADRVVGVLETSKLPTDEVVRRSSQCNVSPDRLTLAVADGEHRRHAAGGRPLGRNGPAQDARIGLRPAQGRQRLRLRAAAADCLG